MQTVLERYREKIEMALEQQLRPEGRSYDGLLEAMRYSLLAGGKRIRPALTLEFCRCAGGNVDAALSIACGIEMLHTYSLIHDDLPCMDNDALRRGKPTNHVVYGECTATLAGDALQAEAFSVLLRSPLSSEIRATCAAILAEAAGPRGMCAGQYLDTVPGTRAEGAPGLREVHEKKTGCMISAACELGVVAAGGSEELRAAARHYGEALGMAFQIRDDMLDELGRTEALGKPIQSDRENGKTTFLTLYGAEKCQQMVEALTTEAQNAVRGVFDDCTSLCQLAEDLSHRMF
jgi:geranylgeranyl diphosphate synthase type II